MSINDNFADVIDENNNLDLCNDSDAMKIFALFSLWLSFMSFYLGCWWWHVAPYIKSTFQQIANHDFNMSIRKKYSLLIEDYKWIIINGNSFILNATLSNLNLWNYMCFFTTSRSSFTWTCMAFVLMCVFTVVATGIFKNIFK